LLSQEDTVFFAAMIFGIVRVRLFVAQSAQFVILLLALASRAQAQEFQFHSVGARVGFPAENTSNNFRQAEAFLNYNLWRWNLSTDWHLQSRLGISAGWLGERGDNSLVGNLGPILEVSRAAFPLSLEGGFSPTYISRHHFGSTDLGSHAQFTSHIGLNWDVFSHWRLGYRLEHMSNGGLDHPNPGFNVHAVSIAYLF
jgi:hypothetical protein